MTGSGKEDKDTRLPYESPKLFDLGGGVAHAATLDCKPGGSPAGTMCKAGGAATTTQCNPGGAAGGVCTSGSTAAGGRCKSGGAAAATCKTGTSPAY